MILQYFTSQERIEKVVIFGSRALGTYRNGSDIDVAVWGKDLNEQIDIYNKYFNPLVTQLSNIPYFYKQMEFYKEMKNVIIELSKTDINMAIASSRDLNSILTFLQILAHIKVREKAHAAQWSMLTSARRITFYKYEKTSSVISTAAELARATVSRGLPL